MTARMFDPVGPLPTGRVVLDASAGTGKTWVIAALVTRYVAELGVPIDRILVSTFTRSATSELRHRVRRRLVEAGHAIEAALGGAEAPDDELLAHLVHADRTELETRRRRISMAVASFDQAVISTIHGFAGGLLRLLGLLSTAPSDLEATGDLSVMIDQVLSDLMVSEFSGDTTELVSLGDLKRIAASITGNPDAGIVPDPASATGRVRVRARLAAEIRSEIARRSRQAGLMTYDDLLLFARDALIDPDVGDAACAVVRSVFDVALVDEFQDTDRTQWDIVSTIFGEGHGTLVIIGDPKQAIYAFRGADVAAYLAAVDNAADQATLGTNWRSDGPLITALEAVLDGVGFGDDRITFQKVGPAPGHEKSSITGVPAPLQIRLVSEGIGSSGKWLYVDDARNIVAGDTAATIAGLLRGGVSIPDDSAPAGRRQIEPSDIGVLCRKNAEIDLVERELIKRSVPVVKGRTGSVLLTEAAGHWLALLHSIERPSSPNLVRRALATPFFGWTAEQIAGADEETLAAEHDRIAGWADLLRHKGVPTLVERVDRSTSMTSRVLGCSGGERLLTDLLHVAEILHTTARNGGAQSLADWLGNEIALAAGRPEEAETRLRRLETDDQAVQLLTIHTAKGLEFPIVMVPFLWVPRPSPKIAVPVFHDPDTGRRMIDVGGEDSPGYETHSAMHDAEQASEDFRLLYVATTRARHHLAVWWAPYSGAKKATLTKVLFGREQPGDRIDDTTPGVLLPHGEMRARLAPILDRADGTIDVHAVTGAPDMSPWAGPHIERPLLQRSEFGGSIDRAWWRWSFTGLTRERDEAASDIGALKDDEPGSTEASIPAGDPLPLGSIRGGLEFGTMIHGVFEHTDFTAADLGGSIARLVADGAQWHGLDLDVPVVTAGLVSAIGTPLGSQFDDVRLGDIDRGHRLDEMYFDLPIDTPSGEPMNLADIGAALAAHLPDHDPLRPYAARVGEIGPAGFHGFLTGAIDLTLALPDTDGGRRWWVADYKTNRLPALGDIPTTSDYSRPAMADAMIRSDYVLQALLYQVALHRYLTFRLPGYDPHRDLGGAMYLFVRGMVGADTPVVDGGRTGVFVWGPHPDLVLEVDRMFGAAT